MKTKFLLFLYTLCALFKFYVSSFFWFLSKKLSISGSHFLASRGKRRIGGNCKVRVESAVYFCYCDTLVANGLWLSNFWLIFEPVRDLWNCYWSSSSILWGEGTEIFKGYMTLLMDYSLWSSQGERFPDPLKSHFTVCFPERCCLWCCC